MSSTFAPRSFVQGYLMMIAIVIINRLYIAAPPGQGNARGEIDPPTAMSVGDG
jgi:hypothetical protein